MSKTQFRYFIATVIFIFVSTGLYFIFEQRQESRERIMMQALTVQLQKAIQETQCPPEAKAQIEQTLEAARRAMENSGSTLIDE